jgi:hypothetical protein
MVATSHIPLSQTGGIAKKKLKYMCFATLDSLNETESNFRVSYQQQISVLLVYFPWCQLQCLFKNKNSQSTSFYIGVLVSTQCTVKRYHFTDYINIWPFARTQLATNDGTQCQNTHADVNYFSV